MKKVVMLLAVVVLSSGVSLAAFDKKIVYKGKTLADVCFDHGSHLKQKGMACKSCHPSIFAKMKAQANKITMDDINKGKSCGVCHAEKGKAFAVTKETCSKCHVKAEASPEKKS